MSEPVASLFDPKAPRRSVWRWVLGLRGLMVLVLVVGGLLGWWVRQINVRREALATIAAGRGSVFYRDADPNHSGWRYWFYRRTGFDIFREVWAVSLDDGSVPPQPERAGDAPARDAVFEAVGRLGRVDRLFVNGTHVTATNLAALVGLQVDEYLAMDVAEVTDVMLVEMGRMRSLRGIRIKSSRTKLTPAVIRTIAALPRLEYVDLSGFAPLRGTDLAPLRQLEHLTGLGISPAPTDEAVLDFLLAMKGMKSLNLLRTRVTDAQLRRLVAAMPWLENLALDGALLTDPGVEALVALPRLKTLSLTPTRRNDPAAPNQLTDASLRALGRLRSLHTLMLHSGRFTAAGLDSLRGLPLKNLMLGSVESVSDASLARLLAGRTWRLLGLHGPGITDTSLPALAAAVNAGTILDLADTGITDAGTATLAPLPLQALSLTGTTLTDAGLATLATGSTVGELVASETRVTLAGAAAFRAARPRTTLYTGPVVDDNN